MCKRATDSRAVRETNNVLTFLIPKPAHQNTLTQKTSTLSTICSISLPENVTAYHRFLLALMRGIKLAHNLVGTVEPLLRRSSFTSSNQQYRWSGTCWFDSWNKLLRTLPNLRVSLHHSRTFWVFCDICRVTVVCAVEDEVLLRSKRDMSVVGMWGEGSEKVKIM
jgi:hypothetical protein